MKVSDVRGGRAVELTLKCVDGGFNPIPPIGTEIALVPEDPVLLVWEGNISAVRGNTKTATNELQRLVGKGYPYILYVASSSKDHIKLGGRQFATVGQRLGEALEVGIDDRVVADVKKGLRFSGSADQVGEWLKDHVMLPPRTTDELPRMVASAGPKNQSGFRIFGDTLAVDIIARDNKYLVERVVKGGNPGNQSLILLQANIYFSDVTRTGEANKNARQELDLAVQARGSYLKIWEDYAKIEAEVNLAIARAFGTLEYSRCERRSDGGWTFHLVDIDSDKREKIQSLSENVSLEANTTIPSLFLEDVAAEEETSASKSGERNLVARVRQFEAHKKQLQLQSVDHAEAPPRPPAAGYLHISTRGDEVRTRRRKVAEELLRTGQCGLPQIGLVMEGATIPVSRLPQRDGLSSAVKAMFGDHGPTPSQKKALEIAVNTPDICLIQGPPGTGKTKVITALEARLAEIAEEEHSYAHRILVSAAQHDAVENVAYRTEVYGLPAVKIGKRSGASESTHDPVAAFRDEALEKLRTLYKHVLEPEKVLKARNEAITCLKSKTLPAERSKRLKSIYDLLKTEIGPTLADELLGHAYELRQSGTPEFGDNELIVRAIRGLRVDETAFGDDGRRQATKLLLRLGEELKSEQVKLLEEAGDVEEGAIFPRLDELRKLRDELLDHYAAEHLPVAENLEKTQDLLLRVFEEAHQRIRSGKYGPDLAVAEYMDELENNLEDVRDALEHYSVVVAATLQQSAGRPMQALKGVTEGRADFESVIIDEAARAHPLDLFIPLSMATRRVVLVGDHRQLPHLLEPLVEEEIGRKIEGGELEKEMSEAIKDSLFQRLWDRLKELEAKGGPRRTVTLDQQFRMHPILGEFVSKTFYEHHGDTHIHSPVPESEFGHELDRFSSKSGSCVAAWIDIPFSQGGEKSSGQSKSRTIEAKKIAQELQKLLTLNSQLTFGVIAFYRAQVDEICDELSKFGITERNEFDTGWVVSAKYAVTSNAAGRRVERLRIGTVDAFQGMEFDVVFLSLTRSNKFKCETELEARKKYGHLLLDNRMCVAMSRQQRLLITVGDAGMVKNPEAPRSLKAFYQLCGGQHGAIL